MGGARGRDHGRAPLVERLPRFGEGEAPRGTPEEGDPHFLLEALDLLADRGRRQPELARRPPEGAALHELAAIAIRR